MSIIYVVLNARWNAQHDLLLGAFKVNGDLGSANIETSADGIWSGNSENGLAGSGVALKITNYDRHGGLILSQANGKLFYRALTYNDTWSSWVEAS